ncbi:hypothetical protein [Actinoplanes sp. NPDC049802]|uniref:hypothetical protein n=1 Tax=Actinoplanes sp. NPDC049802 TaxID=3154742 RepID=UPI00340CEC4A
MKGTAVVMEVSGSPIGGLHPGAVRRTRVTVTNPFPFAIAVRSVEARVASTSERRCRPVDANLQVGTYLGVLPLSVPGNGRKPGGEFEVTMPNTVVDACRKASFKLVFTATATRVDR